MWGDCRLAQAAQASDGWGRQVFVWLSLCASLALAGCGGRGFSIEDVAPDTSIVTGSIAPQRPSGVSDEATIRNAVSSAIVDEIGEAGIGWANAGTGSRGAIREVRETRDGAYLCRSFAATRESFEGVHLYRGETCLNAAKEWAMHRFERVE